MAIIQKKDIISQDAEKPFDVLLKQYDLLIAKNKDLVNTANILQKAFTEVKRSSDGKEAKELVKVNENLAKSNNQLTALQKERVKVEAQLKTVLAKNLITKEKDALLLEKGKARLAENNRLLKQQAKEAIGLTGAYDKLSRELNDLRKAYKNAALDGSKNDKELKAQLKTIQQLDKKLKNLDDSVGQNQRSVGKYRDALKGFGKQFIGALGLTALVSKFVSVLKNAGQIFVSFEKNSSNLAAILGKTKDEISALTEQAKQLGATTAFTASEVIKADTELAKLGFTTKEIENAIPGVLSLASATGTDLASSAELAAATLRIFNMDASEMGKVSDVLAKSTTISSLSMEKLATIMPTVGKTAQLAGVSLERTAALAGTLTDRGLDASTAATSLRNIFLELAKKGLTWEQAMTKINTSTDKNKTAMELFGKRAAAAGSILAETGSTVDRLTESLEGANGAAKDMADTMLNNLAGDMTIAQSAWEGFILSLEDGDGVISRVLRKATQLWTKLLDMITKVNNGESLYLQKLKKDSDFQGQVNKRWEEYLVLLRNTNTEEETANVARNKRRELQNKIRGIEFTLNKGTENGIEISKRRREELKFEIDAYKELIPKLEDYIPEIKEANDKLKENTENTNENNDSKDNNAKLTAKQKKELDKLNKSREKQLLLEAKRNAANLENQDLFADLPELLLGTDIKNRSDAEIAETKRKEKEKAKIEKEERMKTLGELYSMNQDFINKSGKQEADALLKRQEFEKDVKEAAQDAFKSYASDVAGVIVDDKLQKTKNQVEAEKDLLKDQLDKGLINEIQYNQKIAELNKKERTAEARAEKKKALYDIAINTAVAAVKALPNLLKVASTVAIGGIQAALVAARPIPKFAKGEINIKGKSHADGGIQAEIEGGESVITKLGTANAPKTLDLINKGLLTDKQVIGKTKKDLNAFVLQELMKNNSINEKMLIALENGVSQYELNGVKYIIFANGRQIRQNG